VREVSPRRLTPKKRIKVIETNTAPKTYVDGLFCRQHREGGEAGRCRREQNVPCEICHGPDLRGLGPIPSIAGRSPSYVARQLYDFQHGARAGDWSPLMARVVTNFTDQELVSIVAYLASRDP
jgi:cytochrome c553